MWRNNPGTMSNFDDDNPFSDPTIDNPFAVSSPFSDTKICFSRICYIIYHEYSRILRFSKWPRVQTVQPVV